MNRDCNDHLQTEFNTSTQQWTHNKLEEKFLRSKVKEMITYRLNLAPAHSNGHITMVEEIIVKARSISWRVKQAQCLVVSIEICDSIILYVGIFIFLNRYVVTKLLEVNGRACPMKELLPRETEKTSDAPAAVLTMLLALAQL